MLNMASEECSEMTIIMKGKEDSVKKNNIIYIIIEEKYDER